MRGRMVTRSLSTAGYSRCSKLAREMGHHQDEASPSAELTTLGIFLVSSVLIRAPFQPTLGLALCLEPFPLKYDARC